MSNTVNANTVEKTNLYTQVKSFVDNNKDSLIKTALGVSMVAGIVLFMVGAISLQCTPHLTPTVQGIDVGMILGSTTTLTIGALAAFSQPNKPNKPNVNSEKTLNVESNNQ